MIPSAARMFRNRVRGNSPLKFPLKFQRSKTLDPTKLFSRAETPACEAMS